VSLLLGFHASSLRHGWGFLEGELDIMLVEGELGWVLTEGSKLVEDVNQWILQSGCEADIKAKEFYV
jgi:hypothetical protein